LFEGGGLHYRQNVCLWRRFGFRRADYQLKGSATDIGRSLTHEIAEGIQHASAEDFGWSQQMQGCGIGSNAGNRLEPGIEGLCADPAGHFGQDSGPDSLRFELISYGWGAHEFS
jgi:hypothetical protein